MCIYTYENVVYIAIVSTRGNLLYTLSSSVCNVLYTLFVFNICVYIYMYICKCIYIYIYIYIYVQECPIHVSIFILYTNESALYTSQSSHACCFFLLTVLSLSLCPPFLFLFFYTHIYACTHIYIYIYIFIYGNVEYIVIFTTCDNLL